MRDLKDLEIQEKSELRPRLKTTFPSPPIPFTSPKKHQLQNILNFFHFLYHINTFLLLFK
jgi:hypothetical protein